MNKLTVKILNKIGLIGIFNFKIKININKEKFIIPIYGSSGVQNLYTWESWMLSLLKKLLLNREGLFVDVGAGVGQTLLNLKSIKRDLPYIGFEPNPSSAQYVNSIIKINKLRNTHIVPVAIAKENTIGELCFYNENECDQAASLIKNFRLNNKILSIKHVPLLSVKSIQRSIDLSGINILKIDVEGFEYEVLESFKELIKNFQPVIIIEILPVYSNRNSQRCKNQNKIEELITSLDYVIFRILKQDGELSCIEHIIEIGINSEIEKSDYLIVPKKSFDYFENIFNLHLNNT